jgi:hypothetical protein
MDAGYIFFMLKTLTIDLIKKINKLGYDEITWNVEEEYLANDNNYDGVDERLYQLNKFLKSFLTDEEIVLYKFYKMNSLKITAVFYNEQETKIKSRIMKINAKIKRKTKGKGMKQSILNNY